MSTTLVTMFLPKEENKKSISTTPNSGISTYSQTILGESNFPRLLLPLLLYCEELRFGLQAMNHEGVLRHHTDCIRRNHITRVHFDPSVNVPSILAVDSAEMGKCLFKVP